MNYSSHNMDVAVGTLLFFGWSSVLEDLSFDRTIEAVMDLLYTLRNKLQQLTKDNILLFLCCTEKFPFCSEQ